MPVHCEARDGVHRVIEPDGTIATNDDGTPLDGGGHETSDECSAQARAINANLTTDIVRRVNLKLRAPSSPVEIIYAGTFHLADRNRRLEVSEEMVDQMVTNFQALQDEDRIQINCNHNASASTMDEAKAVGWLQAIYAEQRTVDGTDRYSLMGIPRWTDEAAEAIDAEEFRFLSAEIHFNDTDTLTGDEIGCRLAGLALTNIPAIPQLAPVHLTQMSTAARVAFATELLAEKSLNNRLSEIVEAFFHAYPDSNLESYWPLEIYEDRLIVVAQMAQGEALYRVDFTTTEDAFDFVGREEWVEVERVYQPVTANMDVEATACGPNDHAANGGTTGDAKMEERLRELLGIGAEDSIEDAVAALKDRPTAEDLSAAQEKIDALEQQVAELSQAKEAMTATDERVEQLTKQTEAFEKQCADLSDRLEKLTTEKAEREATDRIDAALEVGKITPAELEDGFLRTMAQDDPETFDKLMATRPASARTKEIGSEGNSAPVTIDELFRLVGEKMTANPELTRDQARAEVFSERPELRDVTKREG